eukprot:Clim_evm57s144 gene=Clim_evmTU57s144
MPAVSQVEAGSTHADNMNITPKKRKETEPSIEESSAKVQAVEAAPVATPESFGPLQVKLWSDNAKLPARGSSHAAGYDLYAAEDRTIEAQGKAIVPTDISIAVPAGTYGRIAPRSSLAWKHHIDVGAGVIDEDYRGKVGIVLYNLGKNDFEIKKGDRCAQLILERIITPEVVQVDELVETDRGAGGFGSTGKN